LQVKTGQASGRLSAALRAAIPVRTIKRNFLEIIKLISAGVDEQGKRLQSTTVSRGFQVQFVPATIGPARLICEVGFYPGCKNNGAARVGHPICRISLWPDQSGPALVQEKGNR